MHYRRDLSGNMVNIFKYKLNPNQIMNILKTIIRLAIGVGAIAISLVALSKASEMISSSSLIENWLAVFILIAIMLGDTALIVYATNKNW